MKTYFRGIALGLALGLLFLAVHVAPVHAERAAQTIFLYFVGSDLETDHELATSDLAEIARAAAANPRIRLVAYVGGAQQWHSFVGEGENAILVLEKDGWAVSASFAERNMCDPATLSDFLHHGVARHPADSYALLLWNHGAGPMVGYGQDQRFGDDRLTLAGLARALEESPFGPGAPAGTLGALLEWIGFDACLMSSVETAHAVAPYARYMIASQEIVPGIGWSYLFLRHIDGREPGADVGAQVIRQYFDFYDDFYDALRDLRPGYGPHLTLSCLDLGAMEEVERALDALAAKMMGAVHTRDYSDLVRARLDTSDYGRFSTGAELDLIDLVDMAHGYVVQFPWEARALLSALEKLVVHSHSNHAGAGGVSIYFPFYNKELYQSWWGPAYGQLAFSPGYTAFLQAYAGVWLGERLTGKADRALSEVRYGAAPLEFTLQLTPEQLENYASARYMILSRSEGERYQFLFSSEDVALEEGLLRANYDGRALFSRDPADGTLGSALPFREIERTEDWVRYLVFGIFDMPTEGGGVINWETVDFQLEYDRQSGETRIVGIIPSAEGGVPHGKQQLRQADANHILLPNFYDRYKTVGEDGAPLPFAEWADTGVLYADEYKTERTGGAGVEFVMSEASTGSMDLYLMLEVRDTQGNAAASALLPVYEGAAGAPPLPPPEPRAVDTVAFPIDSPGPVALFAEDGIRMTLTGAEQDASNAALLLQIENNTGGPLWARIPRDASVNGYHLGSGGPRIVQARGDGSSLYTSSPVIEDGETLDLRLHIGLAQLREIYQSAIRQIELTVEFCAPDEYQALFSTGPLCIETEWALQHAVALRPEPSPGLIAPQQVALGDVRVHLLSASVNGHSGEPEIQVLTENQSDYEIVLTVERASADGYMAVARAPYGSILPGKRAYGSIDWDGGELRRAGLWIPQGVEFEIFARLAGSRQVLARSGMLSVALDVPGTGGRPEIAPAPGGHPEITVFDVEGVRMTIERREGEEAGEILAVYRAHVQNDGDADIEIKTDDAYINGVQLSRFGTPYLSPLQPILPGKRAVLELNLRVDHLRAVDALSLDSFTMRFLLIDAQRQELRHTSEEIRLAP